VTVVELKNAVLQAIVERFGERTLSVGRGDTVDQFPRWSLT
jgi:hypothetical protein